MSRRNHKTNHICSAQPNKAIQRRHK